MVHTELDGRSRRRGDAEMPTALASRRLEARVCLALVLAQGRYWSTVAPIVRRELRRWELCARAIEDPRLRALALQKLHDEGFHAEAAAMLATIAPRGRRSTVVQAIVALEILFDYLDGLSEIGSPASLADGERLFAALIDGVAVDGGAGAAVRDDQRGGYLQTLSSAVARALGALPAARAIADVAGQVAEQSAQAQIRIHAAGELGPGQLREWATAQLNGGALGWREFVVGAASSVLVLHALIAAAADPRTTAEDARELAAAYQSTCVLLTLLDGLVDYEQDAQLDGANGHGWNGHGYLGLYEDRVCLPEVLAEAARRAAGRAGTLPHGAHHVLIVVGVAAHYGSAPGAGGPLAAQAVARLQDELAPLMGPTLALTRAWRGIRRRGRGSTARG